MIKQPFLLLNSQKWFILSLLIVSAYLLLIFSYAENIPYADDLAILSSVYDINHAPNWHLKFKLLFDFHNEHRIAVPRLITLFIYYLQCQHINFTYWIITGNLFIFFLLYLFFKAGFTEIKLSLFVPVLFLVLQPMHCELMYWGMASLQNIGVLVLSSLSFYYLSRSTNKSSAFLTALLAVFTSANGLFTFIVGTGLLLYKKEWYTSLLWIITGCISGYLYWHGFSLSENAGDGFSQSLNATRFATTLIELTGGLFYTPSFPYISFTTGLLLLITIGLIIYNKFIKRAATVNQSNLFFLCCLCFVLLTVMAVSLGRNPGNILSGSRYKLYPALILSLTYLLLIDRIKERNYIFRPMLLFSIFFWSVSYSHYTTRFDNHSRLLFSHFFNWKYSGTLDVHSSFTEKYYSEHFHKFYQSGQYIPSKRILEKCQKVIVKIKDKNFLKASYFIKNKVVNIHSPKLPAHEFYAVRETPYKMAIYPLNRSNSWRPVSSSTEAVCIASVNTTYWLKDSNQSLFIIDLN